MVPLKLLLKMKLNFVWCLFLLYIYYCWIACSWWKLESFPLVYSITRKNMFMLSIEKENNLLYLLVPGSWARERRPLYDDVVLTHKKLWYGRRFFSHQTKEFANGFPMSSSHILPFFYEKYNFALSVVFKVHKLVFGNVFFTIFNYQNRMFCKHRNY